MGTGHYLGAELFCIKIDENIVVEILGKPLVLRQCLPLHATSGHSSLDPDL